MAAANFDLEELGVDLEELESRLYGQIYHSNNERFCEPEVPSSFQKMENGPGCSDSGMPQEESTPNSSSTWPSQEGSSNVNNINMESNGSRSCDEREVSNSAVLREMRNNSRSVQNEIRDSLRSPTHFQVNTSQSHDSSRRDHSRSSEGWTSNKRASEDILDNETVGTSSQNRYSNFQDEQPDFISIHTGRPRKRKRQFSKNYHQSYPGTSFGAEYNVSNYQNNFDNSYHKISQELICVQEATSSPVIPVIQRKRKRNKTPKSNRKEKVPRWLNLPRNFSADRQTIERQLQDVNEIVEISDDEVFEVSPVQPKNTMESCTDSSIKDQPVEAYDSNDDDVIIVEVPKVVITIDDEDDSSEDGKEDTNTEDEQNSEKDEKIADRNDNEVVRTAEDNNKIDNLQNSPVSIIEQTTETLDKEISQNVSLCVVESSNSPVLPQLTLLPNLCNSITPSKPPSNDFEEVELLSIPESNSNDFLEHINYNRVDFGLTEPSPRKQESYICDYDSQSSTNSSENNSPSHATSFLFNFPQKELNLDDFTNYLTSNSTFTSNLGGETDGSISHGSSHFTEKRMYVDDSSSESEYDYVVKKMKKSVCDDKTPLLNTSVTTDLSLPLQESTTIWDASFDEGCESNKEIIAAEIPVTIAPAEQISNAHSIIEQISNVHDVVEQTPIVLKTLGLSLNVQQAIEQTPNLDKTIEHPLNVPETVEDTASLQKVVEHTSNLQKIDEVTSNSHAPDVQKVVKCSSNIQKAVEQFPNEPKAVENSPKVQKAVENFPKIQKAVENSPKIQKAVENSPKIQKVVENSLIIQKVVEHSPTVQKMTGHTLKVHKTDRQTKGTPKVEKQMNDSDRSSGRRSLNFSDVWTEDMEKFYRQSWGQENYDVNEILETMPSDPSKWKIIHADQGGYFKTPRGKRCNFCREFGHRSYSCPRKNYQVCILCSSKSHSQNSCPNTLCTTCGKRNKGYTNWCVRCNSLSNLKCKICGIRGHDRNKCPDLWRRYLFTTTEHQIQKPKDGSIKNPKDMWCPSCASSGHYQCDCRKSCNPYISTSTRIYEYHDVYNTVNEKPKNPLPVVNNENDATDDAKDMQISQHYKISPRDAIKLTKPEGTKFFNQMNLKTGLNFKVISQKLKSGKKNEYYCIIQGTTNKITDVKLSIRNFCTEQSLSDIICKKLHELNKRNKKWYHYGQCIYNGIKKAERNSGTQKNKIIKECELGEKYSSLNMILIGKMMILDGRKHMDILQKFSSNKSAKLTEAVIASYDYVFNKCERLDVDYQALIEMLPRVSLSNRKTAAKAYRKCLAYCNQKKLHTKIKNLKLLWKNVNDSVFSKESVNILLKFCSSITASTSN